MIGAAEIEQSTELNQFFEDINSKGFDQFESLLRLHNIDADTLIPFARWSNKGYQRICLKKNDDCELLLLCWNKGQKTPLHGHDGQSCQVYFAKGEFEESVYDSADATNLKSTSRIKPGQVTSLDDDNDFHTLANVSGDLALSLHLYANPIEKCTSYSVVDGDFKERSLKYHYDMSGSKAAIRPMMKDLYKFVDISKSLLIDEIENPIAPRIDVEDLYDTFDIALGEEGTGDVEFYKELKKIVLSTPKTASKGFFNQLFGGRQHKAVLGELLAVMLNNSMYTYKVGGVQVGIEKEILSQVIDRVGYGDQASGTFPAGGSMSNFMALLMARDRADENSQNDGITTKLVAYTSAESHYSLEKNAAFIGLGRNNIRKVPATADGRMDVNILRQYIKEDIAAGKLPCFVNATAGTTVLGAFDPFVEIAAICKRYDIWMHIDGAYCGTVLFSKKHAHLIDGVELSDSFSFNPHKMLGTPLTCSIIVTKNKEHLYDSFSNSANYLYQTDHDEYNLGKISFQCGRRNDALKLWTLWKSVGAKGLEKIVDNQFYLADVAREYVRQHPDYELYSFDDSISVCFNYKGIPADELCTGLYENDELMVGYGSFENTQFVRFVTINATNTKQDILNFFCKLEAYAEEAVLVN